MCLHHFEKEKEKKEGSFTLALLLLYIEKKISFCGDFLRNSLPH
jgi:hypothetical protein